MQYLVGSKACPLSNEPPLKKRNMPQVVSYSHEISLLKADISLLHLNVFGIGDKLDSLMSLSLLQKNKEPPIFSPAETEEELQEIIEQVKDVKEIATRVEHADVVTTIRNFMKLFMKRKVAMTYSLTGLCHGRKKVKNSFVESKLYQLLLSVFQHTVHKHTGSASIGRAVSQVLAGSRDWEGGRNERRSKSSDSDVTCVFRVFARKYHSVGHSLIRLVLGTILCMLFSFHIP
ncbi:unnamed protein product [Clavelina lepadiformis]|uniref:DUF4806 domain-containing protein n=1 Tax=Clavelina lepadiformis TaxID=159417 RepID=A0ABP0FQ98_CLALP